MILYWALPTDGAGHAVRATAICRWLDTEVLVLRGIDDPEINKALDHYQIPYKVIPNRTDAIKFAQNFGARTFVLDDRCNTVLDDLADLYVWRLGRPTSPRRAMRKVRIEGPGSLFPLVLLDESEILSKEEAREDLGLPQDAYLKLGVRSTCRPGLVESQNPDFMIDKWPALRWMRAADHVVAAIGYNTYAEVAYCGLPATWIKAPHAKDQAVRMWEMPKADITKDVGKTIASMIEGLHGK